MIGKYALTKIGRHLLSAETTDSEDVDVEDGSIPDDDEWDKNEIEGMNDVILVENQCEDQRTDAVQTVEHRIHHKPVSVTHTYTHHIISWRRPVAQ